MNVRYSHLLTAIVAMVAAFIVAVIVRGFAQQYGGW